MSRNFILSITILGLFVAGALHAASVDQARNYIQNRELDQAKQELAKVLASDAGDEEMAAALDLMAAIAVEEWDYATAADLWTRLMADYPGWAEELGVATKLQLTEALLGRNDVITPEPAPSPPPVEAAPAPVQEAPAPVAAVPQVEEPTPATPAPESKPAPAPESIPQQVATSKPVSPRTPGLVLVAAAGKPYDAAEYSGAKLTAFLVGSGVNAESPTGGIPVVEDSATSLARMLETVEDQGAESLAFMRVNFQSWQRIAVEVYAPDGSLLWEERIRGGTGYTGRPYSKTGANEKLLERFLNKLAKRVGGPGLPVTP